jgi:hypothetical protein
MSEPSPERPTSSAASGWESRPLLVWGLLVLLLALSILPRLPWLANATHSFNSDEAVDALVVQHLLHRGELTLYNWDTHYYGIVEGVLTIPFLAAGLAIPLASKLGSLVGFLALVVGVFLLGRRLQGPAAGLAAAALLVGFSPQVVQWSVLASGGYALVVAWGTLTFVQLDRYLEAPSRARLVGLGFMVGFGLYIYELFLVYVATLACAGLVASLPWRVLLAPNRAAADREIREIPRALGNAAWFLTGFALGWAPKLALLFTGTSAAGKRPIYALAHPRAALANLRLLVTQCIPAFLGIDPAADPRLGDTVGHHPWPFSAVLGLLLVSVYAAAWGAGARRVWPRVRDAFRWPPGRLDVSTLLVLLVPIVGLLFVLSPNPQDAFSNRYLLPWLTSLPVLAGALLVRLGRAGRAGRPAWPAAPVAAWTLGALLVAFPLVQIARWDEDLGYLDARLHLLHPSDPMTDVLRYLRQEGVSGGYGNYWISYKTTLLSGERVVVTPLQDWDRYAPYSERVATLPTEAYIFGDPEEAARAGFPARLAGRPFALRTIAGNLVYTSSEHRRLLPPFANPRPLLHPRAGIVARVPAVALPGETLVVPVTVTNRSDRTWSAVGVFKTGVYRVGVGYRWFDDRGKIVVAEGDRSRLPRDVPTGVSAEVATRIPVPAKPGAYRLRITVVQEGVAWFDDTGGSAANFRLQVRPPAPAAVRATAGAVPFPTPGRRRG